MQYSKQFSSKKQCFGALPIERKVFGSCLKNFRAFSTQISSPFPSPLLLSSVKEKKANIYSFSRDDIYLSEYEKLRKEFIEYRIEHRNERRIRVGPLASITFEDFDLLWIQIHEMLLIEKGGEEQIKDEISAYSPLLPLPNRISFTMMLEIDLSPDKRKEELTKLSHIEDYISLQYNNQEIKASPLNEDGIERTTKDGKTSAIHFMSFNLSDQFVKENLNENNKAIFAITHPNYYHSTRIPFPLFRSLLFK